MKEVYFHPEALEEFDAAVEFYESRLGGLGIRFSVAVESSSERLAALPGSGSPIVRGARKVIVLGFPYNVIYHETETNIEILAVAHHYRSPEYWSLRSEEY